MTSPGIAQTSAAVVVGLLALLIAWVAGSDYMRIRGEGPGLMVCGVILLLSALFVAHGA